MESRLLTVGLARLAGEPRVRWNNYNPVIEAYQGELIDKDRYKRAFLGQREKISNYDYAKITSVLDMIIRSCVGIREDDIGNEFDDRLEDQGSD
jgi:hypothetical protein